MTTTIELLDRMTIKGDLFEPKEEDSVRCFACAHRCLIRNGRRGICRVRFNTDGNLHVPWGYVAGLQADPIEKKPFFHFLPSATALTFGMLGCNFHCDFCQNWLSSQAFRDPNAQATIGTIRQISPEQVIAYGKLMSAEVVASSYNEPLITSEWAVVIFKLAVQAGMKCVYVSNGNATPEALKYLQPYLTGFKIDLKSMQDKNYRRLGGVLKNVLDTIQQAKEIGIWVEVVTLVVPGFNDSNEELWEAARFLANVSLDIPWHVTAFHQDYKLTEPENTPVRTLLRAAEIGREAGLRYVYAGNIPGRVEEYENTFCPKCNLTLVKRWAYVISEYQITAEGKCPKCGTPIAGVWTEHPEQSHLNSTGLPRTAF